MIKIVGIILAFCLISFKDYYNAEKAIKKCPCKDVVRNIQSLSFSLGVHGHNKTHSCCGFVDKTIDASKNEIFVNCTCPIGAWKDLVWQDSSFAFCYDQYTCRTVLLYIFKIVATFYAIVIFELKIAQMILCVVSFFSFNDDSSILFSLSWTCILVFFFCFYPKLMLFSTESHTKTDQLRINGKFAKK